MPAEQNALITPVQN